jgi:hypothetical protein
MARKKKKQRNPYKKGRNIWKDKRGAIPFLIPIIFIALIILFLIVLVKAPEICLFGGCWRLISLKISKGFMFWLTFSTWLLIQVAFVFICVQIARGGSRGLKNLINNIKNWTLNFERYVMQHL